MRPLSMGRHGSTRPHPPGHTHLWPATRVAEQIPYNPPHENDSRKTLEELKYLQSLETDKDYAKKYDDVPKVFVELLNLIIDLLWILPLNH